MVNFWGWQSAPCDVLQQLSAIHMDTTLSLRTIRQMDRRKRSTPAIIILLLSLLVTAAGVVDSGQKMAAFPAIGAEELSIVMYLVLALPCPMKEIQS